MYSKYSIDRVAEKLLLIDPMCITKISSKMHPDMKELVRDRIRTIRFDCTPNWGVKGVKPSQGVQKHNWYFIEPSVRIKAQQQYACIDVPRLKTIITYMIQDIVGKEAKISGFGLYGSYFYEQNSRSPEDLDVLIIIKNVSHVALDALRYDDCGLKHVFQKSSKGSLILSTIGASIVSEDTLKPSSKSYIITDSALLDISTTFNYGNMIKAPPLPPFLLIHNAQKMVRWGVASLLSEPSSFFNRINEAIYMRKMMVAQFPIIGFRPDVLLQANMLQNRVQYKDEAQLFDMSKGLMSIFSHDEQTIREFVISRISHNHIAYV